MQNLETYYLQKFNANPEPYVISTKYPFKFPILTDTHLLMNEPSNRREYIDHSVSLLFNIDAFFKANDIKDFAHAGDLYDTGDKKIDTYLDNVYSYCLHKLTDDRNAYIVYGNHEETHRKYNKFFEVTRVESDFVKSRVDFSKVLQLTDPCFKAVDKASVGPVNIYFMHFDKEKRYYIPPSDKINIAIFHEDILTLESKIKLYHHQKGMGIDIETTNIMENVDIAICGHIHTPLEPFRLNNNKHTLVIVPGSLCQRTRAEVHDVVNIPVICLTSVGEVVVEYAPIHLGNITETIDEEVDESNTRKRKLQKEMKKCREHIRGTYDMEEFLDKLEPDVRAAVLSADKEIMPTAVAKYYSNKY